MLNTDAKLTWRISLQYDVKKIEEVVYDISLRGLAISGPPTGIGSEVDDARAEEVLRLLSGHA